MNPMYDPSELFASTAPYYARYRPGYPPQFFTHITQRFALNGTQTALDLGCGTGQIAIPLAPHVATVIAVDPEPTMLHEGQHLASERKISNIVWKQGDSHHLRALALPPLDLVTMGASFHWTNREKLLQELDSHITEHGGIIVASGGAPTERTLQPWTETITKVRTRHLGEERRAGSQTYTHPTEGHETILARSSFSNVEVQVWEWERQLSLDEIIGLQFSYSFSSPVQFSDETTRRRFEHDLRTELTQHFDQGPFTETIRTEALIATRPAA